MTALITDDDDDYDDDGAAPASSPSRLVCCHVGTPPSLFGSACIVHVISLLLRLHPGAVR